METKSANLLAKGYELIDGITVPVGTSAHRFFELRDHATARMLGAEKDVKESEEAKAFKELLLKYNLEQ